MKFFAFNQVFLRLFCVVLLVSGFSVSAQQLQDSIPLRLTEAWEYAAQYSKEIKLKQLEEKIGAEDVL
ncbi:MAG: TolC family protein, partial [Leeuwenhoekiella sp.]